MTFVSVSVRDSRTSRVGRGKFLMIVGIELFSEETIVRRISGFKLRLLLNCSAGSYINCLVSRSTLTLT